MLDLKPSAFKEHCKFSWIIWESYFPFKNCLLFKGLLNKVFRGDLKGFLVDENLQLKKFSHSEHINVLHSTCWEQRTAGFNGWVCCTIFFTLSYLDINPTTDFSLNMKVTGASLHQATNKIVRNYTENCCFLLQWGTSIHLYQRHFLLDVLTFTCILECTNSKHFNWYNDTLV